MKSFTLTPAEIELLVDYSRKRNLKHVNGKCLPVTPKNSIYVKYIKRIIDIVVSALALILTLPFNIVIAVCTYFDLGRPIFFFQKRPGRNGDPITIVKFRNMTNDTDENGHTLRIEDRVTKLGAFMRKTSLDELLNFWSVFKGDMSLIGPRPLLMVYLDRYSDRHMMRHAVRPGLECPNLENHGYCDGWHEQFENNIWYVENVSFIVDCKMILCLVKMVFSKKIRKAHASTGVGEFIGYNDEGHAFGETDVPDAYLKEIRKKGK